MFALLLAAAVSHGSLYKASDKVPNSAPGWNLDMRITGLKERIASYLVTTQMTGAEVTKLIGQPFGVDSFGPPGEFYVVYSYLASGISITFGPDGKVKSVDR